MGKPKKEPRSAEKVIAMLYDALSKPHWQEGVTYSEAIDAAHDWFYNTYGYNAGAASAQIPKILRRRPKLPTSSQAMGKPKAGKVQGGVTHLSYDDYEDAETECGLYVYQDRIYPLLWTSGKRAVTCKLCRRKGTKVTDKEPRS